MTTQQLKGMTWDHPRGLDCLVNSDALLQEQLNVSVDWSARSLLAFGDQHISEFYGDHDLMIIDHPHVPDAVHANAVIALEDVTDLVSAQPAQPGSASLLQVFLDRA